MGLWPRQICCTCLVEEDFACNHFISPFSLASSICLLNFFWAIYLTKAWNIWCISLHVHLLYFAMFLLHTARPYFLRIKRSKQPIYKWRVHCLKCSNFFRQSPVPKSTLFLFYFLFSWCNSPQPHYQFSSLQMFSLCLKNSSKSTFQNQINTARNFWIF